MSENLSKSGLLILSFGFMRNINDDPWFRNKDLQDAFPYGPLKRLAPSRGQFSKLTRAYIGTELLSGRGPELNERRGGAKSETSIVRITEKGKEELLDNLARVVTSSELTLTDLLPIPNLPVQILEVSDLPKRIVSVASGINL